MIIVCDYMLMIICCLQLLQLYLCYRYTEEEIETKVTTFRKMLMAKEGVSDKSFETDDQGRPMYV